MSQTVSQDEKDSLADISAAEKGLESSSGNHTRKSTPTTSYGEMRQLLYRRSWALLQVVGTILQGLAILLFGIVLLILSLAAAKLAFLLIFGAVKMIISLLIMLIGFIGIPMPAAVAQWEPFGWF